MLSFGYTSVIYIQNAPKSHSWDICKIPFSHQPNKIGSARFHLGPLSVINNEIQIEKSENKEKVKRKYKWVRLGPDFTEEQNQVISLIPPMISNRCKAMLKQIICYTPEIGPLSLLMAGWVTRMKPRRADWLLVLKELSKLKHPLYLEVARLTLSEESFEAEARDYTKLIHAYAKKNELQEAEKILLEMKEHGCVFDQVTLTTLVHMYSKVGNLNLAESAFEEMKLLGEPLDRRAYGSMVMAYIRAEMLNEAENLIKEMETEAIYAGKEVYKALLRAYSMKGDFEGAQRVFDSTQIGGIVPDAKFCGLLINAYAMAGKGREACIVFENLRSCGIEFNDKCVALVLSVHEKENKLNKAMEFLVELEKDGYLIGKEASEMLVKWFRRLGVVEEVELVLRDYALNMDH